MNERCAKLCHWAGANTGLRKQETSICSEQDYNGRACQLPNPATVGFYPSHRHWRGSTWEGFTVGISYTVDALTGTAVKSNWAVI